ncbi:MAG: hypothetical protein EPN93_01380 [Spirochaetes bacterium]|nr:MAG: hypothetical protein EPN93_01380 [Spirochaetota bacterium]
MILRHVAPKTLPTALLAAWILLLSTGCSLTGERDEALKESARWFELVGQGKYDESSHLLHPGFLESTSKDNYTSMLKNFGKAYGNPVSHSLTSWSAQTGGARALVVLVFDVKSAKGVSVIKLTFTRTGDDERPRILLMSIEGAIEGTPVPERAPAQRPEGIMI